MAYTQVTPVQPALSGTTVALSAPSATAGAGNGEAVPAGSMLWVNNGGGSPITITLRVQRNYQGYTIQDPAAISVPNGTAMLIGPIPADPFGAQSGTDAGRVHVDYSSVTSVTRAWIFDR